ncbi:MAG: small, acid-soluble spore protein, alpha/beta type [Firmicutes bacterium]|nr:small, acid-soluble spore protein, alpha/beta type [Bacillota bacterium]
MGRKGHFASERLKMEAARELGIADKINQEGWEAVTTKEVGLVVRNMIKRGEEALVKEAREKE